MPRWWRSRSDPSDDAQAAADEIRRAVAALIRQRADAARTAGTALVNQATVQQALHAQRHQLDAARAQLDESLVLAVRVADTAAAEDGEAAAAPYRRHVEGLESQGRVIDAARSQLDALGDASHDQVGAARTLLARSYAAGEDALRVQLRLLVALERLERERVIRLHRSMHGRPPGADR